MQKPKHLPLPKGTIVPNHIAFILDGNGRWARSRGLPVTKGHEEGAMAIKTAIRSARKWGVHTLSLWGFSTENWKRPYQEKRKIFNLVMKTIRDELTSAKKEGVRFNHIGRKDRLPKELINLISKAELETKDNNKYVLNIALDYGGRDEIIRAVKKIIDEGVPSKKIDEDFFSSYLDTAGQPYPNPDLLIRTSGELRTSGFLPWQMVYSEFYFESSHLPDITPEKVRSAILDYSRRRRRFGAKDRASHFKFDPSMVAKLELAWWRLEKIPKGTKFSEYLIDHIQKQFGFSKELAVKASKHFLEAIIYGDKNQWKKSKLAFIEFYKLIKDEVRLAFEPTIAATLEVKFRKEVRGTNKIEEAVYVEDLAKELYAEVYRISLFQAAKLAHLRVMASFEKNLAERGHGDIHWQKAEDYLQKFYFALKERVA
jgi:undecaprenyl diphosphate synthase